MVAPREAAEMTWDGVERRKANDIRRRDDDYHKGLCDQVDTLLVFMREYQPYLKLMIERERQMSLVRRAIIEKTLTAIIWSVVVAAATLLVLGVKSWIKA